MSIKNWNNIPRIEPSKTNFLYHREIPIYPEKSCFYGNGRSYSDVCLTKNGVLVPTKKLNRFLNFDVDNGFITCEAGVRIIDLLNIIVPAGWFLTTSPGTKYATIGGMVANDVHGKNHHQAGSFGNCIESIELSRSDVGLIKCSENENKELFFSTIGGLGLTGLILNVTFRLKKIQNVLMSEIYQKFRNLDEFWEINETSVKNYEHTVAWVDCTAIGKNIGRGIYYSANEKKGLNLALKSRKKFSFPFSPPISLVNNFSVSVFNKIYYNSHKEQSSRSVYFDDYFYPLDSVKSWNKIYGNEGFYQYQYVIPNVNAKIGLEETLKLIKIFKTGSFLIVLKTFGDIQSKGFLSFPREGVTLAVDLPNNGKSTISLMSELDKLVLALDGALYPAKDCRISAEVFEKSFPKHNLFTKHIDPCLTNHFWERVKS